MVEIGSNDQPLAAVLSLSQHADTSATSWREVKQQLLGAAETLRIATGQISAPVNLDPIMVHRRIVAVHWFSNPGALGASLVPTQKGFLLRLSKETAEERKRFSIAHEIGHTFFYDLRTTSPMRLIPIRRGSKAAAKEEDICHAFARSLLLPFELLADMLRQTEDLTPLDQICTIARKFRVSIECAVRRILYDTEQLSTTIVIIADDRTGRTYRLRGKMARAVRTGEKDAENKLMASARKSGRNRCLSGVVLGTFYGEWRNLSLGVVGALTRTP
jgi:Zn-dependent peptidase ImmA (M78 family)